MLSYFCTILHVQLVVCVPYDITFDLGCGYLIILCLEIHIWPVNLDSCLYNQLFRNHLAINKPSLYLKTTATSKDIALIPKLVI